MIYSHWTDLTTLLSSISRTHSNTEWITTRSQHKRDDVKHTINPIYSPQHKRWALQVHRQSCAAKVCFDAAQFTSQSVFSRKFQLRSQACSPRYFYHRNPKINVCERGPWHKSGLCEARVHAYLIQLDTIFVVFTGLPNSPLLRGLK